MSKHHLTHWLAVIVIGLALGLALQFVRAWTEPAVAPPNGNLGAPINTSATGQTKSGNFTSNGIISAGDQFCLRGSCISTWPSGTTTTTITTPAPTLYQCPDDICSRVCGSSCLGQVSSSSTCQSYWCSNVGDGISYSCGGGGIGEPLPRLACTPI